MAKNWWRVIWHRKGAGGPIVGNAQIKETVRFRQSTESHNKGWPQRGIPQTWRHKCYFPKAFYPARNTLPKRRIEIILYPQR